MPAFAGMTVCGEDGEGESRVKQVEAAVIGVGWVGGTRAETLARTALVDKLHLCDIKPDRLAEVKALYRPATATLDYQDIIKNDNISVVFVSTTPESNHYPIARDCLRAGKNVMLEKPIALELWEADELIMLAKRNNLKFTIGYSQRFNTKIAYAKKKITDGTLGKVVSVLVSRHLSRSLGKKIASRVRLSPVVMESTHDLDFVFWLLEPAKPVRVYSQGAYGYMEPINGSHDVMFTTVTMDNGVVVMIGGGWNFPPSYPNYCATWIEITGTDGALVLDDTQRDNWLNTEKNGQVFPMSTMPGEMVDHVFAGGMGPETIHFVEVVHPRYARDGDAGERAHGDGDLHGRRPVRRPQRAGQPAADQRDHRRRRRLQGEDSRRAECLTGEQAAAPAAASSRHLFRTRRSGLDPGIDERAGFLLRARRGRAAEAGRPGPADQSVGADVMDEVLQRPVAVARRILDLRADLSERLAFPCHLARREMPFRMTGHAAGIEVGLLVADRAPHGRKAMAVRAPRDRRLMEAALLALARMIAGRMAVHAARMSEHLAEFGEQCGRAGRFIGDRVEALRRGELVRRNVGYRICGQHAHQQRRDRNEGLEPHLGFHLAPSPASVTRAAAARTASSRLQRPTAATR